MDNSFARVMGTLEKHRLKDVRTAALIASVDRLNKAMLLRGLFP